MAEKTTKANDAFDEFVAGLPSFAARAITCPPPAELRVEPDCDVSDEAEDAFDAFVGSLPGQARAAITVPPPADPERPGPDDVARFALVETTDGEWSKLRVFKTAEGLARRIGALEGTDTVVVPFFGLPLKITRGPQRYLTLPNGQAVQIPLYDGAPARVIPADLMPEVPIQEDGFIGPIELSEGQAPVEKAAYISPADEVEDDD